MAMPVSADAHLYQYAIVRGDLQMPPGKLAAQSGHAYTDSLMKSLEVDPETVSMYRDPAKGGSKVTLKCKNVTQLLKAYQQLLDEEIPCALIVDQHHVLLPHFTGEPIITAVGIGPCTKDQVKHITKKFQCV